MAVAETIREIMDGFDAFYKPTAPEETDDAKKLAMSTIVRARWGNAGPRAAEILSGKVIDLVLPYMRETKPIEWHEMRDLVLGVLGTNTGEVERVMRAKILKDRVERLVTEVADTVRFHSPQKGEEWGSPNLVFSRLLDGWEVTLAYFPEYVRPRVIYGHTGASPQVSKNLTLSVRYHKKEHYMVKGKSEDGHPDFLEFLKSKELDKLAKTYEISYELPALGNASHGYTHKAKGGYEVMVESLDKELSNTPYSAEKLISRLSTVHLFHQDDGLGVHLIADFPKGRTDLGQNLTFAFGADLSKLPKEAWDEFKKIPPIAIAALKPLKGTR